MFPPATYTSNPPIRYAESRVLDEYNNNSRLTEERRQCYKCSEQFSTQSLQNHIEICSCTCTCSKITALKPIKPIYVESNIILTPQNRFSYGQFSKPPPQVQIQLGGDFKKQSDFLKEMQKDELLLIEKERAAKREQLKNHCQINRNEHDADEPSYSVGPVKCPNCQYVCDERQLNIHFKECGLSITNSCNIEKVEICSVCTSVMSTNSSKQTLQCCKFTFHTSCLNDWFKTKQFCPNCYMDAVKP